MDIKIDIAPEAIERQIVDAIVKAGIGKRIETAVLASLAGYSFQRAVEEATTEAIRDMVRTAVLGDADLREKVRGAMADKLTEAHMDKLLKIALKIDRDD
jgi:hypothetical protein